MTLTATLVGAPATALRDTAVPTAVDIGPVSSDLATMATPGYAARLVVRDGGYSAVTADRGDLWVFDDTIVFYYPPGSSTSTASPDYCGERNGTAAIQTRVVPGRPPALVEPAEPGVPECPARLTDVPYQFLPTTTIFPGGAAEDCSNWTTGLTTLPDPRTGRPSDTVAVGYVAQCFAWGHPLPTSTLGSSVTTVTVGPVGSPIRAAGPPPVPPLLPDRPCPGTADALNSGFESPVLDGGYLYLFDPYGLGPGGGGCHRMGLARVPVGRLTSRSAYRFLTAADWSADPTAAAADIMPADYAGTDDLSVSVSRLPGIGEFVMTYNPASRLSAGEIRTALAPWGPWSVPQAFTVPGWSTLNDYGFVLHPELDTATKLVFSYSDGDGAAGAVADRIVTLPLADLPAPPAPAPPPPSP